MKEKPVGKRPLGRYSDIDLRLRWEDIVGKDVKSLNGGPDWKARAADRESWRIGCGTR